MSQSGLYFPCFRRILLLKNVTQFVSFRLCSSGTLFCTVGKRLPAYTVEDILPGQRILSVEVALHNAWCPSQRTGRTWVQSWVAHGEQLFQVLCHLLFCQCVSPSGHRAEACPRRDLQVTMVKLCLVLRLYSSRDPVADLCSWQEQRHPCFHFCSAPWYWSPEPCHSWGCGFSAIQALKEAIQCFSSLFQQGSGLAAVLVICRELGLSLRMVSQSRLASPPAEVLLILSFCGLIPQIACAKMLAFPCIWKQRWNVFRARIRDKMFGSFFQANKRSSWELTLLLLACILWLRNLCSWSWRTSGPFGLSVVQSVSCTHFPCVSMLPILTENRSMGIL